MKRLFVVFIVLSLLMSILLTACGGGGEEETSTPAITQGPTATAILTETSTATSPATTATPNATPGAAVKIGAIMPWSGPLAGSGYLANQVLAMIEKKVKDRGGILGGRELKIIKYDDRGSVSDATAGATKLVKEDNVCAIAWGGASSAEINAVASTAEELKVLYAAIASPAPGRVENELKYTVLPATSAAAQYDNKADLIINKLKPKTVAFLFNNDADLRMEIDGMTKRTEPAGIETVYEELVNNDVMDIMSYLTTIKRKNPDVLVMGLYTPQALTAAKQIMEIGGWGTIQVVAIPNALEAAKLPGSVGWIVETAWIPGLDYPASRQFEEDFKAVNKMTPTLNHMWFYTPVWTIIEAIEQTGTDDREIIAQYARSGNLQWDTPMGIAHFTPDGNSGINFVNVRIVEGGKIVPFE